MCPWLVPKQNSPSLGDPIISSQGISHLLRLLWSAIPSELPTLNFRFLTCLRIIVCPAPHHCTGGSLCLEFTVNTFYLYLRFKLQAMKAVIQEQQSSGGPGDQAASLILTLELWVFPVEHCSLKWKTASYFSSKRGLYKISWRTVIWSQVAHRRVTQDLHGKGTLSQRETWVREKESRVFLIMFFQRRGTFDLPVGLCCQRQGGEPLHVSLTLCNQGFYFTHTNTQAQVKWYDQGRGWGWAWCRQVVIPINVILKLQKK